jgi:Ca2+:H+ antiporter
MPKLRPSLDWLLVLVPVSIALELAGANELLIFLTSAVAILPLAGLIGRSTDQLAMHTGPRIGGLVLGAAGLAEAELPSGFAPGVLVTEEGFAELGPVLGLR